MSSIDPVHPRAKAGFQDADAYSSHRVQCTPECVKFILDVCALRAEGELKPPNLAYDILELGAGTGKFTGVVQPYLHKNIGYLATEPGGSFLRKLEQNHPGVHTKQCSASSIPLPDQSVNTVIAAQAFHWFASTESLTEIWRVLVRGGCLVLVWNERDGSADKWVQDVGTFVASLDSEQGSPRQQWNYWKKPFQNNDRFTDLMNKQFCGPVKTGRDEVTAFLETLSVIQSTDAETSKRNMEEMIGMFPAGEVALPFVSELYWCFRV